MRLAALVRREAAGHLRPLAITSLLSAAATVTMLWVVGTAAEVAAAGAVPGPRLPVMFALAAAMFAITHARVAAVASREVEAIIHRLRVGTFADVGRAELTAVEAAGRGALQDALVRDADVLARTLPLIVVGGQQLALLVVLGAYLLWLSPFACLATLGCAGLMLVARAGRMRALEEARLAAAAAEARAFDRLTDLLHGFKEVRMNRARRDALVAAARDDSAAAAGINADARGRWADQYALLQASSYLLVGVVVFGVPLVDPGHAAVVVPASILALFLVGPLGTVAQVAPLLGEAEGALARLAALRERMRQGADASSDGERDPAAAPPREIGLEGATFVHRDHDGGPAFVVGPISARFAAGQITFVTGGNGAGKSTMLRLLTGLLAPAVGVLLRDGTPVPPGDRQAYRDAISAVFADYHLTRRVHGVPVPDSEPLAAWLRRLGLAGKTTLRNGAFGTVALSTGQRRRLALLVALLEERPVIVLDEPAAEQDPAMRRAFYEELLPSLRAEGRIVICATHDERWFHLADRLYHMEDGRVAKVTDRAAA